MKIKNIDVNILKGPASGLPVMSGLVNEHTVRAACAEHIKKAAAQGKRTVMVPALGTDRGRFPLVACAKIISQEVLRAGREGRGSLGEINICLDTDEAFDVFAKQVFGYLRHVTEDMGWGPYVTTDIIIEVEGGVVVIERTNPPFGLALPGGFVDAGESLETAACREAKEETNLELKELKQFHTYSDPKRDPRFHTVTTVFTAKGVGEAKAGDDAKGLKVVPHDELLLLDYAFDHKQVIREYLDRR
ncbi:MAG: NUDIX domain-containing protein [Candidatus Omnitrophota bacterium]